MPASAKMASLGFMIFGCGCEMAGTTVKKYIIPKYTSKKNIKLKVFQKDDLPEFAMDIFDGVDNWGDLCSLSKDERDEIVKLWDELLV